MGVGAKSKNQSSFNNKIHFLPGRGSIRFGKIACTGPLKDIKTAERMRQANRQQKKAIITSFNNISVGIMIPPPE